MGYFYSVYHRDKCNYPKNSVGNWSFNSKKKREAKKADMRKGEKLMCITCKPIEPKDESWWDDMDRDAQEYLASLEQEADNEAN